MNTNAIANLYPAPSPRFVDNGDGTITDNVLRLMWSKETNSPRNVNQKKAAAICAELDLAGHNDWRLPTVEEMFALADRTRHSPAIDTQVFPDTHDNWYWTSTITAWASSSAWIVNFSGGGVDYYRRASSVAFVRAVRSLPSGQ